MKYMTHQHFKQVEASFITSAEYTGRCAFCAALGKDLKWKRSGQLKKKE